MRPDAALTVLRDTVRDHPPVAFACSFSIEDVVLVHLIAAHGLDIRVFTLDTGRLPAETIELKHRISGRYGIEIACYRPEAMALAGASIETAPESIYGSLAARHECCHIRKVEPLKRALSGSGAWITGQRRAQSKTRATLPLSEWDEQNRIQKANPLAEWSTDDVWDFVRTNDVPYNRLYDRGYASIGCAPCTRPIAPGEDIRAGRWWWESPEHKECGIHRRMRI